MSEWQDYNARAEAALRARGEGKHNVTMSDVLWARCGDRARQDRCSRKDVIEAALRAYLRAK